LRRISRVPLERQLGALKVALAYGREEWRKKGRKGAREEGREGGREGRYLVVPGKFVASVEGDPRDRGVGVRAFVGELRGGREGGREGGKEGGKREGMCKERSP